jgi:penicillin amidase
MKKLLCVILAVGLLAGCGDGGGPTKIENLKVMEEIQLSGLSATVDVVFDDRGMPHIYAADENDALMAQGYLMARDRMAQMEFLRRGVEGRLAEVAGSLLPSLVESDIGARQIGFGRYAQAIIDSLPADDPSLKSMQAFADGVNAHIQEIRDGDARLPGEVSSLLRTELLTDWQTLDTMSIARYMVQDLSKSAGVEIDMTEAMVAIDEEFPENSPDPRLAARAGMLHDFWPFAPVENVFIRDEFPNLGSDSGTRAFAPPQLSSPIRRLPSRRMLQGARSFFRDLKLFRTYGGLKGGSNNWAIHGSKTATGNPMMANDPHLGLDSPHKFWYVHLNTKRTGGEMNVQGLALAGTPGILLGYNDDVAWGLTTAVYDVEDVYLETIKPGGGSNPDTVEFNGNDVPIQIVQEVIKKNDGSEVTVEFELVPHHGLIIPETREDNSALVARWKGAEVSNELRAVMEIQKAGDVDEVETALDHFGVGAQCWAVATREGDIYWSSASKIPIRDPRALTYDPDTGEGFAPCFVLPGTGEFEWTGEYLDDRYVPHDLNPQKGYIATANGDPVGATADNNPFNDDHYIGFDWDLGHRQARIHHVLDELTQRGDVTVEEIQQLQGDKRSPLGALLASALVAAVDRAQAEKASPGTHADLSAVVTEAGAKIDKLVAMRDKLDAWSFDTQPAVEGDPTQEEIDDSIATCIFNATIPRLVKLAFQDEVDRIGPRPADDYIARTLQLAILEPDRLKTYDAQKQDTVLWDDLDTDAVEETRDERIVRAMLGALEFLEGKLGTDMNEWRWGKLHTVTFETLISMFPAFSIPPPSDPDFPDGFPRHGDNFGVDASHTGIWDENDFTYGSGPQQRVVVEMTPDGPKVWNAIPGGQVHSVESAHHADEAEYWRKNQAPPLYFFEKDVVKHAEERIQLTP